MNKENLFKKENLIFVSKVGCIIGSLYFLAIEDNKVYRGRIRLCHDDGPTFSCSEQPEKSWLLVNEDEYNHFRDKDKYPKSGVIYGDLVKDKEGTINQAKDHHIYEIYSYDHPSRGILSVCGLDEIKQTHIDRVVDKIVEYKDNDNVYKITTEKRIKEANQAIVELTNSEDMPKILKQEEGKYGC